MGALEVSGHDLNPGVLAGTCRDQGLAADAGGQNEAVIIVGMFADQIDPAGRPGDQGGVSAKACAIKRLYVVGEAHLQVSDL